MEHIRSFVTPATPSPSSRGGGRSGVSLVEVMVSVLLLFIIFCGWFRMNNIQAVRKESYRYEAVERAAGMLDALSAGAFIETSGVLVQDGDGHEIIRYKIDTVGGKWFGTSSKWYEILLYDDMGGVDGNPFTSLRILEK